MSDVTVIDKEPETTPAELPASADAPAQSDSWDDVQALLDDFEQKTASPEPEATASPDAPVQDSGLDDLLRELGSSADQQKITDLEGQINSLHEAELQRQSRADFEAFSKELQDSLGPNLPDDYAKSSLLALAAQDPNLEAAWKYRGLTNEQLAAANREFRQLEALHFRATHTPGNDPRKQQAIAMLEQRGMELGLAMNARAIIANARRSVIKRAESFKPIDAEATADRDAIAQYIRDGQGPAIIPEAPVQWGKLSGKEFREKVLRDHGFDPGGW